MTTAFDPIVLGGKRLASRVVMAPMTRSRAFGLGAEPTGLAYLHVLEGPDRELTLELRKQFPGDQDRLLAGRQGFFPSSATRIDPHPGNSPINCTAIGELPDCPSRLIPRRREQQP
ncbi:hypothetical protein GCM10010430_75890 [Kitasatospora cystarginea]|uniref:NADH:flavin oxidoreductase/NADH oxidase N-terminal domain-containing protein n=1 Tax=Kitasatospora cystarginea TaxID=58350 RepID=A0ABP5RWH4_9ACTN